MWRVREKTVEGQEVGACDQSDCSPVAIHTVHVILLLLDADSISAQFVIHAAHSVAIASLVCAIVHCI